MKLVTVAPGRQLAPDEAASFKRMERQRGKALPLTSAYRSPAEQRKLRAKWLRGEGPFALPAGQSRHEQGEAADFQSSCFEWLEDGHAAANGWHRTNPDERWHYEYVKANDKHLHDDDRKPNKRKERPEMFTIRRGLKLAVRAADRRYALVTGDRAVSISVAAYARFKAAGHSAITLPEADYDKIVKTLGSEK